MFHKALFGLAALVCVTSVATPALADDDESGVSKREVPFMIKMDAGDSDVLIARNNRLRLYARCTYVTPTRNDFKIFVKSSRIFAGSSRFGGGIVPGGSEFIFSRAEYLGVEPIFFNFEGTGTAVQYGRDYIGVDAETTSLGGNIFGADCFAAGTAILITNRSSDDD